LESEGLLHPRSVGSYLASLERLLLICVMLRSIAACGVNG
jgi:hypothetical protein